MNVFHPFELLPGAWTGGAFNWEPDRGSEREPRLTDHTRLRSYVADTLEEWRRFVHVPVLEAMDPLVDSPRGTVLYRQLLDAQRRHAAFDARQFDRFLADRDTRTATLYDPGWLALLDLPVDVY